MKHRIVLAPVYMNGPQRSSSTYFHFKGVAQSFLKRGHAVVFLAREPEEVDFEHPNLIIRQVPAERDQYFSAIRFPECLREFGKFYGYTPADAVITSAFHQLPQMRIEMSSYIFSPFMIPTIGFEVFPKFQKQHCVNDLYVRGQIEGYRNCDRIFLGGRIDYNEIMVQASEILPPAEVLSFRKKFDYTGFSVPDLGEVKELPMQDRCVIFGRFMTQANPDMLDFLVNLTRSGGNTEFCMTQSATRAGTMNTGSMSRDKFVQVMDSISTINSCPRPDFLALMKSSRFVATFCGRHNFPTAVLEAAALGVPCLLPDLDWIDDYLPGYPFVADKDPSSVLALAKYLAKNPVEARAKVAPFVKHVGSQFSKTAFHGRLIDATEGAITDYNALPLDKFRSAKLFMEAVDGFPGGTTEEATLYSAARTKIGVRPGIPGTLTFCTPVATMVRVLIESGYLRTFENGVGIWQKS